MNSRVFNFLSLFLHGGELVMKVTTVSMNGSTQNSNFPRDKRLVINRHSIIKS